MTEVISKERLLEIAKAPINKNNEELQFILRWLITTECKELDPWLLVDENMPKDKYILIFDSFAKSQVVAKFDDKIGMYLDRNRVAVYATHYKLLPEDPK